VTPLDIGPSGTSPSGGPAGSPGDPSVPSEPLAQCDTPGPRTVRRLTAKQYDNTLNALVGDGKPVDQVLPDPANLGFHLDADALLVSDLTAELLMNYSERVAAWAVENRLNDIAHCTNHDQNCHRQFIEEVGRQAFRQTPNEAQMSRYLAMFEAEDSFETGMAVVLATMLQSPYLLYRRELGEQDPDHPGQFRLTALEMASELSYLLTDGPPDQQLLDAATQGRLGTNDDLDREAERLLSQPSARDALTTFVHGWLEVDGLPAKAKDQNTFDLTPTLRDAMLRETREFFLDAFYNGGTAMDLFGADYTFVNQELASFYGLGGAGGDFQRVSLAGSQRATGVLGQGAFLTEHALPENSSPVQRGARVRERVLCQELPEVPENLDTNLDPPDPSASNRERYAQHSADDACSGCHSVIDPVGFAFEEYDGFGRYRDQDRGQDVDASGELSGVVAGPIALDGLNDLNAYLSSSDSARSCLVRYWSYFAYGRDNWEQKECNHDAIRAEAGAAGYDLKSTLLAIIHAPHFSRRVAD